MLLQISGCLLLCAVAGTQLMAQPAGISSEWDARTMVSALNSQSQRIEPVLLRLRPDDWVAHGAAPAYQAQLKSTQTQLKSLQDVTAVLSKQPERLTSALDTYFRLQTLENNLNSLSEGARKYQNPALAELILGMMAENSANREHLRQYIVDLAATQEQELQIANKEAQRCRTSIARQPTRK